MAMLNSQRDAHNFDTSKSHVLDFSCLGSRCFRSIVQLVPSRFPLLSVIYGCMIGYADLLHTSNG